MFSLNIARITEAFVLLRRMFGRYKKQIIILAALGFVSGLLEALGVNALIPLFSFFSKSNERLGGDFIAKYIQPFFEFLHLPFTLPSLLILICILFLLKAALTFYFSNVRQNIRNQYERDMMSELFKETLGADWPYLSKQKIGHLETVIMMNVRMGSRLLESIAKHVGVITELLMYLTIAITISKTITIMTLGLGIFIFLVFKPLLRRVRTMAKEAEGLNKEVSRYINESIGGMKIIKALGSEDVFVHRSHSRFDRYHHLEMRMAIINNFMISFIQPISVIFMVVVVAFTYYRTSYNLGALAAIIYLIQKMFGHIQSLQTFAQILSHDVPYIQGILAYKADAALYEERKGEKGTKPFSFAEKLAFNNVSFAYEKGDAVLGNLSFEIPKGSTVGFIGKSGSGKTTLFDLVLRLLKPASGIIEIDGVNVENIGISDWRNRIAYVPQDAFLLNDTIYNNIIFYNEHIPKEDVEQAAKLAHLNEFVKDLKDGYETVVGERGVRLSGGQRQRIAIARALARRPEILLLDEATSALDVESEAYIQEALRKLKGKMTILIIAHRLGTVSDSDMLIVLEEGHIIESGKPADLLKDKETYYGRVYNIHN
jgi:ATP-binding cassette subfamily C protein